VPAERIEMNDDVQIVTKRWPSARALHGVRASRLEEMRWRIFIGPQSFGRRAKSVECDTPELAWADAARRLKAK